MRGVIGVVDLHGQPIAPPDRDIVACAGSPWSGAVRHTTCDGAAFGPMEGLDRPYTGADRIPRFTSDVLFTADGRLDNRDDLFGLLSIPTSSRSTITDAELMRRCHELFGEECVRHLLGDWIIAAWRPAERRLFLARDRLGVSALFYTSVGHRIAFASSVGRLLALSWVPRRLNEARVARVLVGQNQGDPGATTYLDIHRVCAAEAVIIDPTGHRRQPYWTPDDVQEAEALADPDYAGALAAHLEAAVRPRLRASGAIGATLSAGLDSASVAVTAARQLAEQSRALTAFTAVPRFRTDGWCGPGRFGDEGPFAALVARRCPNIRHMTLSSEQYSPLAGIRTILGVLREPVHGAGKAFWIAAMLSEARRVGINVLLVSDGGNLAMSWGGRRPNWLREIRRLHAANLARRLRSSTRRAFRRVRAGRSFAGQADLWRFASSSWRPLSAISEDFARDINLKASLKADPFSNRIYAESRRGRASYLVGAATRGGAYWSQLGSAFGVTVRDPTMDPRLVSFALSVPEGLWEAPMSRWLFRDAMKDTLPPEVRLRPTIGFQSADIVQRLRATRDEVDDVLASVERSPLARRCVDLAYCRRVAAALDTPPDPLMTLLALTVLLRGLGVAMFLRDFDLAESP